ncbi:hypothetical protein [uncultured Draconibacterium sp.]|uniref:hypothetical protein n=1 Tax=uncultured Draconibacterium sp. TaxID=1573823 RepID=UPI0025F96AED|nr:hypothetical protein [uncultured Draconibacterium sp.]
MRKLFTLIATLLLSVLAGYSQPDLPDGFVSVYSINGETEQAPITIDGGASAQLLGPASGWGASTDYDLSNYEKLSFKITFDPADAGKQVAIRFNVNLSVKLHIVTLPEEGTSFVEDIFLSEYADENGTAQIGGIVFYNGASHWSFSYDGTAATEATTIDYIAVNEKIELPLGYVSFYSTKPESERAPMVIPGGQAVQVAGPADWGPATDYDLSDYDHIAFKITFDPADAGHQIAIRFNINGSVKLHQVTLPESGTSFVEKINLTQYADENGAAINGGIVIYNGASHWSFSYDGTAATEDCTLDYIALKKKLDLPEGYVSFYTTNVNIDEEEKAPIAIPGGQAVQLAGPADWGPATDYDLSDYETLAIKINYDAADAGNQVAIRFNINGSVKLHIVTLPTEGTSVVEEIDLLQYADANGNAINGGIFFYNGATHWSFSYDGTAATQACTIGYVALKQKPAINIHDIPEGYISVYDVIGDTASLAPLEVAGDESYQLLGSPEDWGSSLEYDFSAYEKLAIQVVYDSIDAGSEVALRFSVDGWTYAHVFTLPLDTNIVMEEIDLADYVNIDGAVLMGGIIFYNGASHWSFSYEGLPATQSCTIDFVALKQRVTGIDNIVVRKTTDPNKLVDVYNMSGVLLRKGIPYSRATKGLKQGLYIVDRTKVFVMGTGY